MDTETEKKDPWRPTIYTPDLAAEFCRRIASGRTKRSVCADEDMPHRDTINEWLRDCDNEEKKDKDHVLDRFSVQYALAREEQAENIHDEIVEIADDSTNDFMEIKDKKGHKRIVMDKEAVLRSRLRVDARLSWLANTAPRKYGKIRVESQALDKHGEPADQAGKADLDGYIAATLAAIEKAGGKDGG